MSFRIIAIRPINECNENYTKILASGTFYPFFSYYDFSKYDTERIVTITKNTEVDLYSIETQNGRKLDVNISAIAGKNGSGKSSIIELLYAAVFNISVLNKIVINEDTGKPLTAESLIPRIRVDLFYEMKGEIFLIHLEDGQVTQTKSKGGDFNSCSATHLSLDDFFYSISINYSHYALNTKDFDEDWLRHVFHKNDAYQTPIVINPMRTEGDIYINNENDLVRSRLLSNLLSEKEKLRTLTNEKTATSLKFQLNKKKIDFYHETEFSHTKKYGSIVLPIVYKIFLGEENPEVRNSVLIDYAKEYILRKLDSICKKYKPYKRYRRYFTKPNEAFLRKYVQHLKDRPSHITLKIRQAIYFLAYGSCISEFDLEKMLPIDSLVPVLKDIKTRWRLEMIEIIPPSIFKSNIYFDEDEDNSFEKLSSGEKQYIYSLSSLLYHLDNLDSVDSKPVDGNKADVLIAYKYVNIIFDEIELYYHPDLQRTFIFDLIQRLRETSFQKITQINLIFVTHSPFILSDIPSTQILFLTEKGEVNSDIGVKTFGANIHDLLKHSFFLTKGAMGEFAKSKINNTIDFLNYNRLVREIDELESISKGEETDVLKGKRSEISRLEGMVKTMDALMHKKLIDTIDEPILRTKLTEMYADVIDGKSKVEIIQQKIKSLQAEEEKLKRG